jgi:hypothetical protein
MWAAKEAGVQRLGIGSNQANEHLTPFGEPESAAVSSLAQLAKPLADHRQPPQISVKPRRLEKAARGTPPDLG